MRYTRAHRYIRRGQFMQSDFSRLNKIPWLTGAAAAATTTTRPAITRNKNKASSHTKALPPSPWDPPNSVDRSPSLSCACEKKYPLLPQSAPLIRPNHRNRVLDLDRSLDFALLNDLTCILKSRGLTLDELKMTIQWPEKLLSLSLWSKQKATLYT